MIKALAFDIFGTIVDWRSSIIREGERLSRERGLTIAWDEFADAWRAQYRPEMDLVRRGKLPWMKLDDLHRRMLDRLLAEYRIQDWTEAEIAHFNFVWHRLTAWSDCAEGLERLRSRFITATLSNGNMSLLTDLVKNAGLRFDCILSAELAGHYKPDREVYLMAARFLNVEPDELLMVAAHVDDLEGARRAGLRTAFIPRPLEYGPASQRQAADPARFDFTAHDLNSLADQLGTERV
jgi:2-haloacid dehalogenase